MRNDVATKAMPDMSQPHFLDILSVLVDKNIDLVSAFLTSMTALTLGMDCKFIRLGDEDSKKKSLPVTYIVSSNGKNDVFSGSASLSKIAPAMGKLTKNKAATRRILAKAGVRTPFGGMALSKDTSVLDEFAKQGVERVLVKPNEGSLGRGIIADVTLEAARDYIQANADEKFVVEQYIVGTDYRIYTVGGEFASCYAQLREHVVGNGRQTVRALIERRLQKQLSNPHCRAKALRSPDKAKTARDAGVKLDAIPKKGELIWLNNDPLPRARDGVYEPVGVTPEIHDLARQVARAVGGDYIAIDMIHREGDGTYILEVNAKPSISPTSFPLNAPANLRLPETVLRHSFPDHIDVVNKVKRYNFAQLIKDFREKPEVKTFNARDYVVFY